MLYAKRLMLKAFEDALSVRRSAFSKPICTINTESIADTWCRRSVGSGLAKAG